jgi:two-component system chemotaxis sensor kinase CheA
VDHGIESPAERNRKGKPRLGSIKIAVSYLEGGIVGILVSDDGGGIDVARVKEAAVKHGVVTEEEAARTGEKEALQLIFQSSVSTSPIITELSGRGLGLAIVREKTDKLGGRVSVTTGAGKGTTFRLVLPLNLATYRGILVKIAGHPFIVPIANVERTLRIKPDEIKTMENKECVLVDGEVLSLARMENILGLQGAPEKQNNNAPAPLLILASANTRIAFTVGEVLSEQEIIVKNLGRQLARVRNIAGATVTGSGEVVLILNVSDLIRSAVRSGALASSEIVGEDASKKNLPVLVVEDSITSRMLIKNILESNGYLVTTAVDGMDAWTKLRTTKVDLVVSDIDMPRMNGFDLVLKIRADAKLSELPIILLTARESREDRERGVEVGANAYIVKSGFDQSVLLNVLKRLA